MLSKSDCIALALNKRCAYNYVKVNVIKTRQSINLLKKKNQNTPRNRFENLCMVLIKSWNLKVKPLEQFLPSLFHGDAGIVKPIAICYFVPNLSLVMI